MNPESSPTEAAEPRLSTRSSLPETPRRPHRGRAARIALFALLGIAVLLTVAAGIARHWMRSAARENLPQISGTLITPGLAAPVTVTRNAHGIPSIHARTFNDLLFAQGFVTAQDRLFQMDTLRRHASGELAEILGAKLVPHDRLQRTLALGPAADRILTQLPPDQRHHMERYAAGVNAALSVQQAHLPLEFRVLAYQPRPWTTRDCVLVSLVLFEDLTNTFPTKLNREALTARLAPDSTPEQRAELLADLYPVGSWRDHPPSQPATDLTTPVEDFPDVPLDDTQVQLHLPATRSLSPRPQRSTMDGPASPTATPADLLALTDLATPACPDCRSGSNNFAVSGAHTASGKPLLANDMHLSLSAPGIWYAANLQSDTGPTAGQPFHAAGVSLPGVPYLVVGHNDHVAWGFTNLGADVQDLYIEHLDASGTATRFQAPDGQWHLVTHRTEIIKVRGGHAVTLELLSTRHGSVDTPLLTPILPSDPRSIALRWSLYDTEGFSLPFAAIDSAASSADLLTAVSTYTGPSQNLVFADDAGHIGYHAIGRIPLRGNLILPSPLSPVPTDATGPDAASHEWVSTIPFDQLPSTLDPAGGILATANARITPDNYPFPLTNDWADPYRNERIWRLLTNRTGLVPADLLHIQTDVFSDSDHLIAQRFAYAIDRSPKSNKRLRLAADLLRSWNGDVTANSAAAAIATAAREALWPLLLAPQLTPGAVSSRPQRNGVEGPASAIADPTCLYSWGERNFALEQIIAHTPARWLPSAYASWDDLLVAAVDKGLLDAHAPSNLSKWSSGKANPVEIQLPLFAQLPILRYLAGLPSGTGVRQQNGNGLTIRQSRRAFGPSERFSADLANPDADTLVLPLGESGDTLSPWFLDQFPAWLDTSTFPLPFTGDAGNQTLQLLPAA